MRLLDAETRKVYPLRDEIYLRGTVVTWYSRNQWRRRSPESKADRIADIEPLDDLTSTVYHIGPPVIQQTVLEPYLDRDDLFYIWPLIEPINAEKQRIRYDQRSQRLSRKLSFVGELRPGTFTFEVKTSGLADGEQAPLVPAGSTMSATRSASLANAQWQEHLAASRGAGRTLAAGSRFRERTAIQCRPLLRAAAFLVGPVSILARRAAARQVDRRHRGLRIEPSPGALRILRHGPGHDAPQPGNPRAVVLGYRCDEWDPQGQFFQVRQLHAHAWVEAFLAPGQIPESLRRDNPDRWANGGWLRLDGTPAADLGTSAANRTTWGAFQAQMHGLEHYWENYIADMDRTKQQQSVYEPIRQGVRDFLSGLVNPTTWREFFADQWAAFARTFASGIMGKLIVAVLVLTVGGMFGLIAWFFSRLALRSWRRLAGRGSLHSRRMRSSVEFYHRFEQLVARCGLLRSAGQTPREFALAAARTAGEDQRPAGTFRSRRRSGRGIL